MNHSSNSPPGSLFLTPRSPNGKRLQKRAQGHMHASDTAVGRALGRAGRWLKNKLVPGVKEHGVVGAEGSKQGSERLDGQLGVGFTTNKRVMENQKRWDDEHPGHEFPGSGMNGFR